MSPRLYLAMGSSRIQISPDQEGFDRIVEEGCKLRHHMGDPVVRLPHYSSGGCL